MHLSRNRFARATSQVSARLAEELSAELSPPNKLVRFGKDTCTRLDATIVVRVRARDTDCRLPSFHGSYVRGKFPRVRKKHRRRRWRRPRSSPGYLLPYLLFFVRTITPATRGKLCRGIPRGESVSVSTTKLGSPGAGTAVR